jgi:hypothetical protein
MVTDSGRARCVRVLLYLLAHPELVRALTAEDWDRVVRVARSAKLLAELGIRSERCGALDQVPAEVQRHLQSERAIARHVQAMAQLELCRLTRSIRPLGVPIVLLKGAAYLAQSLPFANGRWMGDVDIMVPHRVINEVEGALKRSGWEMQSLAHYDEHYYRDSHELPPLRFPRHPMELDVHHTILPPAARLKPDADELFAASHAVPGTIFRVLCPEDQVLHACVHLFHDSDCANRLRDLVDIAGLIEHFSSASSAFWPRLRSRADLHGLGRPLWYGLHFVHELLSVPISQDAAQGLVDARPSMPVRIAMGWLVPRSLLPTNPDRFPPFPTRLARKALFVRSHWLRMPPLRLARHLGIKGFMRVRPARRRFS